MRSSTWLAPLFLTTVALSTAFGQGALQPSGAPAAGMKRLDQVEPRRDLLTLPGNASALIVVSQPGSYYLSADLAGADGKHGILVTANNVSIDLRGFNVTGSAASNNGLHATGTLRVSVRNGNFTNWSTGVALGTYARAEDVSVADNRAHGLTSADHATLARCGAASNSMSGFLLTSGMVADSFARSNGAFGFGFTSAGTATRCQASSNQTGFNASLGTLNLSQCSSDSDVTSFSSAKGALLRECLSQGATRGFVVGPGSNLSGCSAHRDTIGSDVGFNAGAGSSLAHCTASNWQNGFQAGESSTFQSCTARSCSGSGISAGAGSTVTLCSAADCAGIGIDVGNAGAVTASTARRGGVGIYGAEASLLANCTANETSGNGLQVNSYSRISGSVASAAGTSGIYLGDYSMVTDSSAQRNLLHGILGLQRNFIANNSVCGSVFGDGIYSSGGSRIEGNHAFRNQSYGINTVDASTDYILRNTASSNSGVPNPPGNNNYNPLGGPTFGLYSTPGSSTTTAASNF